MLDPKYSEMDTNCVLVQISRMAPTRRGNQRDAEPLPPPSMAEDLMAIEENRLHNERLLEQLVQQGDRKSVV